ncbi:MAG: single-stranded DNA-binding protein [bacterium]|nr:single-stranded DNA-binding protein [bacterium]
MRGLNKVQIIGNLGRDPDIRYTRSGTCVANCSVAVNEQWTKDGEKQERVEWVRCVLWNKVGEIAEKYLHKGDQIYFEGRLQTREWEDKSGNKRQTTEVNVDTMLMLGSKGGPNARVEQPVHPDGAQAAGPEETDDVPF